VVVHSDRHPVFGRRGKDLTVTVPVTFPEAALGAKVAVPTLDGPVTVKVPPGSKSGKTLRVRGRGVPASSGIGDLLVTVEVTVPDRLTDEARKSVETLGSLIDGESLRANLWGDR
jgi:molecular chaperone DnaJ